MIHTETQHVPIAIIGAGMSGLAVAAVLRASGRPVTIFEAEHSAAARTQGGMLDIHEDTGQAALRAAGLYDAFRTIVHPGGEALRLIDRSGRILFEAGDDGTGGRPEVDRGDLRKLLLSALGDETVQWGHKIISARRLENGRHQVTFAGGGAITTDLLIGGDGAWSRVRPLLTDAVPAYTGISFIETDLQDPDIHHQEAAALLGDGFFMALDGERGFLGHRETDGSLHVYTALNAPEDWVEGIDFGSQESAKATVLESFTGWHETLHSLVIDADGPMVARKIHALPVGVRWQHKPGVTLIGDAAHLMSPFAGEGANLALFDGAELARRIVEQPDDLEAAVRDFERDMFQRSTETAEQTDAQMRLMFSEGAMDKLVQLFEGFGDHRTET